MPVPFQLQYGDAVFARVVSCIRNNRRFLYTARKSHNAYKDAFDISLLDRAERLSLSSTRVF